MRLLVLAVCLGVMTAGCSATADTALDDALLARADSLAKNMIIVDGHVDIPYRLNNQYEDISRRTEGGDFDYVRAVEGGLNAPFMSIYIPSSYQDSTGAKAFADSLIDMVYDFEAQWPEKFAVATSPEDVRRHFADGLMSLPMGMENGAGIEDDLANLRHFYDRGIRYITLTHSTDNLIGDSSYDSTRTWNGLSDFGREVVEEMNRLGIMVDVSHISDETFIDVLEVTQVPVIASHSSARRYTPGFERNMSDEMIEALAQNGGVIMINFGSSFISEEYRRKRAEAEEYLATYFEEEGADMTRRERRSFKQSYISENAGYADIDDVMEHFDHVVQLVGTDHLGIGSDYDGVGDSLPTGLKDVGSYPRLVYELMERGYSDDDIRKILGENVLRVWEQVQSHALNSHG